MMRRKVDKRKLMEEEVEDRDIMTVENSTIATLHQLEKESHKVICPIVFSEDVNDIITDHSIIDIPLNEFIKGNVICFKSKTANLSKEILFSRGYDNNEIATTLLTDFIIQNVFFNACTLIPPAIGYYNNYFYLAQYIQKELDDAKNHIYNLILSCTSSGFCADKLSYISAYESVVPEDETKSEENIDVSMNSIGIISYQIKALIFNAVCVGIDKAINDVLCNVHINPNIISLQKDILDDRNYILFLNCIFGKGNYDKSNFTLYSAMYLKSMIYHSDQMKSFTKVVNDIIFNSIMNYLPKTGFYWYTDNAKMKRDRENIEDKNTSIF